MKKIIFFDGDGTLWYPKTTKYKEKPHWIYHDEKTRDNTKKHLIVIPSVVETLTKLRAKGIKTVVLSANPSPREIAYRELEGRVKHFNLSSLFDEVHATLPKVEAKGLMILKILKKYKLNKKDALMVGDTYLWDCKSAKDVGVQALLIDSDYRIGYEFGNRAKRVIKDLRDVMKYI